MVLMYQQHASENAAKVLLADAEFQLHIMNFLEQEF